MPADRKIVHINNIDNVGGAGRAAYRLHRGLLKQGEHSRMFVANRSSNDSTVIRFRPPGSLTDRLLRKCRQGLIDIDRYRNQRKTDEAFEIFSDDRTPFIRGLFRQIPGADLIHLHWVSRFIDLRYFFTHLPPEMPVVWTLHDMNPFTGGCHYANACVRYRSICGRCPQLGSGREADLSKQIWWRKFNALQQIPTHRLHFVSPSRWLAREARDSVLLGRFAVSVIPNGVDTQVFSPFAKNIARSALEIPGDAKVVLFVADSIRNTRKGYGLLVEAMAGMAPSENVLFLSLGGGAPAVKEGCRRIHLGHIECERLLALVYSASDLFVIPSIQDNLPNTVLEAMACGLPVVGFDAGGLRDMIRHGETGLLVGHRSADSLRNTISGLIENDALLKRMSEDCISWVANAFSIARQTGQYRALYSTILADRRK